LSCVALLNNMASVKVLVHETLPPSQMIEMHAHNYVFIRNR